MSGHQSAGIRVDSSADLAMALRPLPEGHAYVEITEGGDSDMLAGDVVRVDLRVRGFVGDSTYALEVDGKQVIRRIRGTHSGLSIFWGERSEPFEPARMKILGMVKAREGMRYFND